RRLSPDPLRQRILQNSGWNRQARRVGGWPPQIGTAPIKGIVVVPEVFGLVLPRDGLVRVDVGAVLHLFFRQRHIQPLGLPVRMDDGNWRDQHLPAAKPAAGVYREVADGPCLIVEIELTYSSNLAIRGSDYKTFQMRSIR